MKDGMQAGWYHDACMDGVSEISFFEKQPSSYDGPSFYGPFKTFGEAKRDAMSYFLASIREARWQLQEVRLIKKPKKEKQDARQGNAQDHTRTNDRVAGNKTQGRVNKARTGRDSKRNGISDKTTRVRSNTKTVLKKGKRK